MIPGDRKIRRPKIAAPAAGLADQGTRPGGIVETSRDQNIIHYLVDIADNLVEDFDVVELLTGLTYRCVEMLDISAAGVMLASPPGELRLVATSSEAMQVVELFELQSRERPLSGRLPHG